MVFWVDVSRAAKPSAREATVFAPSDSMGSSALPREEAMLTTAFFASCSWDSVVA